MYKVVVTTATGKTSFYKMVDYSPSDVENLLIENHLITSY